MEQNKLVVIGQTEIQKGGLGFGSSKLFKLQPANLALNQKMTRAEGAIPGQIRVRETGQHFKEMEVVLLFEPVERRSYFEGDDFGPDNQICFSQDNVQPHPRAKVKQAMYCNGCEKASWDKYEQTKNKRDIPPCKPFWHCLVIDKETKLPYYLDIRGTSRKPFQAAMQNIARLYALMQSKGENPNIFDISFTIYPVSQDRGAYYTLGFRDFKPLSDAEKGTFGSLYLDFVNRHNAKNEEHEEAEAQAEFTQQTAKVEATIVESSSSDAVDGEYISI